jgi:hypothetical protein
MRPEQYESEVKMMKADEGKICEQQLPHHNVPICLHYTSRTVTNTMMKTIRNAIKFAPRSILFLVPSRIAV